MTDRPEAVLTSSNLRGILWMLVTAVLLTVTGALFKQLGQTLPIAEIVFIRMVLGTLFMIPWVLRVGVRGLATRQLGLHLLRAVFGIGAFVLYVYAISNMLLANAVALAFSTPLWMILVARLITGEVAGMRRGIATVVGFLGVLIVARPDIDVDLAALAALGSALLICLAMQCVKRLSRDDSSAKITFYLQGFGALFTLPHTVVYWQLPTVTEWGLLIGVGLIGTAGLYCQARAYGTGDATAVAPVDFSRLPMAVVIGMLFFHEVPDFWAFVGMAVILVAILYISRRERKVVLAHRGGSRGNSPPPDEKGFRQD
jgi:drug/metabolite transporter (DMT)-like permease